MFDATIAIVVLEDLATWQKPNVTAFLTSGIVGANDGRLGAPYEDAVGNRQLASGVIHHNDFGTQQIDIGLRGFAPAGVLAVARCALRGEHLGSAPHPPGCANANGAEAAKLTITIKEKLR